MTESGLVFHGIVPRGAEECNKNVSSYSEEVFEMLATCHGLSKLNGELVGDPLEVRLFETSGCDLSLIASGGGSSAPVTMITNKATNKSWKIERRFDFSSEKMRSGVVITRADQRKRIFQVKGSPEAISKIVKPDTLPSNFPSLLNSFTRQGLRVLAFAYRSIGNDEDIVSMADQGPLEVEQFHDSKTLTKTEKPSMIYGGLILLANKLKAETPQTILDLHNANMKVAMITGDHVRTAVAVSYNCGILNAKGIAPKLFSLCYVYFNYDFSM